RPRRGTLSDLRPGAALGRRASLGRIGRALDRRRLLGGTGAGGRGRPATTRPLSRRALRRRTLGPGPRRPVGPVAGALPLAVTALAVLAGAPPLAVAFPPGPSPPVRLLPGQRLDPGLDPGRGSAGQPAQESPLRLLDDLVFDVGLVDAELVEGRFHRLGHRFSGCDDPFHRSYCL